MSLKEALLDLFFPPKCPICGRSSEGEKDAPCPPCRQADFWISGPQAVVPGRAFVRCVCAGWYRGALKESMTRFKFPPPGGGSAAMTRPSSWPRPRRRPWENRPFPF